MLILNNMENNETKEKRISLVYCGRLNIDCDDHYYFNIETEGKICFKKKITSLDRIGNIIEVTETEKGVKSPYVQKLEKYHDSDEIKEWSAKDLLRYKKKQIELTLKKESKYNFDKIIEDIARTARYMSKEQKRLLLLHLIEELT